MKVKRMAGAGLETKKRKTQKWKKAGKIKGAGMKMKNKLKSGKRKRKSRGKLSFNKVLQTAKEQINPDQSLNDNTSKMMAALRELKKNKTITNVKRILAVPKQGGALTLLPILGALNTIKKVGESIGAIVAAATAVNEARKQIFGQKNGRGFVTINRNLALHKKGRGLILKLR